MPNRYTRARLSPLELTGTRFHEPVEITATITRHYQTPSGDKVCAAALNVHRSRFGDQLRRQYRNLSLD